ncbi:MAG: PH domain-containing protein [Actinomycetota bacterium]|nr:PH domain-containing protein [Actinomycetota bacterium]
MTADAGDDWHRLHPLSPLINAGRLLSGLIGIFALSLVTAGDYKAYLYQLIVAAGLAVTGFVRWLVTRWKLDGATLRIETGLLRRDSRQLPMTRIQAVDVVRPFLARVLGLAALRIRLAGAGHSGDRLAYLTAGEAARLRATLLAGQHGLDPATPEPAELPVITVPAGRVIGATLLRAAPRFMALAMIAAVAATAVPGIFLASESTLGVIALGLVTRTWQQVTSRYGFTVATSPDGIRIRRGLLSTVAETVPFHRVQAVRLVQPLLWRPFGWCRLVVDVAGAAGRDSGPKAGGLTKSLLPVGYMSEAQHLVGLIFGHDLPELTRPPTRARLKAPLSYHFLAAGHNQVMAVTVTGRVCKRTVYLRLEKLQSVRLTQGPVQRRLSLASVHGDAAGRRAHAVFSDRQAEQARGLLAELAHLSQSARSAESSS